MNILGCELVRTVQEISLYQLRAGESLIDIVPRNSAQPVGNNVEHFCLQITPFNPREIHEQMSKAGIPCGPVENRFGATGYGQSIYIKDPDGNTIELKET